METGFDRARFGLLVDAGDAGEGGTVVAMAQHRGNRVGGAGESASTAPSWRLRTQPSRPRPPARSIIQ